MSKPKGLYILDDFELIYGSVHREIARYVDIYAEPQTKETIKAHPALLAEADFIFSGWGCPKLDTDFLRHAAKLQAVFYGSGTVKGFVTDAFWERDIALTSAYAANAVPVAEFTLAQILFSLKRGWAFIDKRGEDLFHRPREHVPGAYGTTVGIISLGMIGRKVCELLKSFDVKVIAYDPFVSREDAHQLQVELCTLEEVFERADVVSLHAPNLDVTRGMVTGAHIASMKPYATFINTSRGAIVREQEMINVLQQRPDLYALLDVTDPEPPVADSPLYTLENVVLTPHIAGSMNQECHRMGKYMLDELVRYMNGEELRWLITREKALHMA